MPPVYAGEKESHAPAKVSINQPAPQFSVKDTKGVLLDLKQLKGKIVILQWTNHDCPFDRKHHAGPDHNMQSLQKEATEKGAIWISVISSSKGNQGYASTDEEADKNAQSQGARQTHIIRDESGAIGKLYGAKTTPHMYLIDKEGKIQYMGAIDSINSTKIADVAKAEPYFKNALKALLAGKTPDPQQTEPYGCSIKYAAKENTSGSEEH